MSDEMESSQPEGPQAKLQPTGDTGKMVKSQGMPLGQDEIVQAEEKILDHIPSNPEALLRQIDESQKEIDMLKKSNNILMQENSELRQQHGLYNQEIKEMSYKIDRLKDERGTLLLGKKQLIEDYNALVRRNDDIVRHSRQSGDFQKRVLRLEDANRTLVRENALLEETLASLHRNNDLLKKERDDLDSRVNGLLSELANYRRNKTGTYISSDAQQPHLLLQDFRNFKSQAFQAISNQLFDYLSDKDSSLKQNRKFAIAKIKSVLSKEMLKESEVLARARLGSLIEDALGAFLMLPVPDSLRDNIVKGTSQLISDTLAPGCFIDAGKGLQYNTESSIDSIITALQTKSADHLPVELYGDLKKFLSQAIELVRKMANTEPPGELWVEKEDVGFDPDKHEALKGYGEEGRVQLTVYPGYRVDNRVLEKPVVLTVKD
jgi:FtsZ-binding cell division protein ZapB